MGHLCNPAKFACVRSRPVDEATALTKLEVCMRALADWYAEGLVGTHETVGALVWS